MTAGLPAALAVAALLLTAGCAVQQPTSYQPQDGMFGYTEAPLDGGAWRIAFTGNQLVERGTLEDYALRRAAELAREKGFARFAVLDRVYERHTDRTYAYNVRPAVGGAHEFKRYGGSSYADPFLNTRTTSIVTQVFRLDIRPFEGATPPEAMRVVYAVDEVLERRAPAPVR